MKILKLLKILISAFLIYIPSLEASIKSKNFEYLSKAIPNEIIINVDSKKYRKYLKYIINAERDRTDKYKNNILKKYKQWIKGNIIVNNEKYKIDFRIQGELKDHLNFPTSTISIKLKEKNIGGITNFKLFLPETRMGENEVFWTILLNQLNFLSPFTKIVDVSLNGRNYKALFQEEINSEFLEKNNFKATPIIKRYEKWDLKMEGEEFNKLDKFNAFRSDWIVDNPKILKTKSEITYSSSLIRELNFVNFKNFSKNYDFWRYINYRHAPHHMNHTLKFKYSKHFYSGNPMRVDSYDIYFDHLNYIEKVFKDNFTGKINPIYYDGMPRLNIFNYNNKDCSKVRDFDFTKTVKFLYEVNSKHKMKNFHYCIIENTLENLKLGKALNGDEAEKNYLKTQEHFNFKLKMEKNIFNYLLDKEVTKMTEKNLRFYIENIDKLIQIFSFQHRDNYYTCLIDLNSDVKNCIQITTGLYIKFLSGKYKPFILKKHNNFNLYNYNLGLVEKEKSPFVYISNKANNTLNKDKIYIVDLTNNHLDKIEFNLSGEAKLLITGTIKNINLIFNNIELKTKKDIYRNDKNLFTSCITFYEAEFLENVNIASKNFECEDSINIVKSKGKIKNIHIENSKFDGLDVDFSNINFNNILVRNSGNDCVDLSFGNFFIDTLDLANCRDKSLSVGEGSILNLKSINSKNSLIGIASKDNSIVYLNDGYFINTDKCISVYQKKQEFGGGTIEYKNLQCLNYIEKFEVDKNSKLLKTN